jgi:hypothetical protein
MRWKHLVFLLGTLVFLLGCAQPSPEVSLPVEFSLQMPSDGSAIVSRTPTLEWKCSIDAAYYRLQVATDKGFAILVIDEARLGNTSYNVPPGTLTHDRTYYWRVNATSSGKTSAWSACWSFKTVFLP